MEALKKFVGKRNMVANEEACYKNHHQQLRAAPSSRPPSVVTSTAFDDDGVFMAVAQAILFRYESEGLLERDAINLVLLTSEDKRGFLESLDLRNAAMYIDHDEELDDSLINEIVQRTRSTFGGTLKLLWRESITGYDSQSSCEMLAGEGSCEDFDGHRHRLKTPKNLLHSPIRSVLSEARPKRVNNCIRPKSSGRQRRRFFPDVSEQPRCRPRIRFDFKLPCSEPVKSLQLDGLRTTISIRGTYAPPSPISAPSKCDHIMPIF